MGLRPQVRELCNPTFLRPTSGISRYSELDLEKKKCGNALDELNAHRFLEAFNETMTVREMRTRLRASGALSESDRPKTVPITHYLCIRWDIDWKVTIFSTLSAFVLFAE